MSAAEAIAPFNPHPRRILIVLHGAIGDVLRALPLLGRIRAAWPDAHIAWSVEPKSQPILEHHPWLDELIVYDRSRAPLSFLPFLKRVRAGRFDLVLDLQRHLKSGITSIVSGAGERYGFDASNAKEYNHLFSNHHVAAQPNMRLKLLQYQAFGDALNLPAAPIKFGLTLTDDERDRARAMLRDAPRPLLGVILGSSWPSRLYFPESTAAVIRDLARPANGAPPLFPVLLGGPGEKSIAADVMRHLDGARALDLAGRTTLRDLIAIFQECSAAFGPDSGPMHIAAAVGCPVVSLWGSTAAERSAPWGFDDLTISGEIPCHPCYLRQCPIGRECMRRISPAQVSAMVRRALAHPRVCA
ncbi:MAG: glycosyltransferase family 9 protein [Candidatus Binatus sp.]|uniref:glycosyltransferase family 9 protein n=1 Tax=Candidatus Binatus sp. TaxID=2811406 RepID=UPI00272684E4|nr:glycosyltransferase family 9 protein [Candidatus Binatus sp.]MDO8431991.1 glycosyltransferase family 9 protein [Candidatus Binatus sp.]